MIGRTIGNYRVVEKLGEGGMGAVYRAVDQLVERNVAIKVLKPELSSNPEVSARFMSEAKALAKLNHPAIAILYTLFQEGDELFMVMEYVAGQNLEKYIRAHGAIPWPEAAGTLVRVLEGVGHAHSQGIVHRDLKPANLMLTFDGAVKVMDFGIARVFFTPRLTQDSRLVGTLGYLAPERILGKEGDARSDIYALGVIFYEMLTGHLPFEGTSEYELIRAQVEQPPKALHELGVDVPEPIEQTLMIALAKDPAQRQPDAETFAEQLRAAIAGSEPASLAASARATGAVPLAKQTVSAAASKPTVTVPANAETLFAPLEKETVLDAIPRPAASMPAARGTVRTPIPVLRPEVPPQPPKNPAEPKRGLPVRGLYLAIAGGGLALLLAISVGVFVWMHRSHAPAQLSSVQPTSPPASATPQNNPVAVVPPQPAPATPVVESKETAPANTVPEKKSITTASAHAARKAATAARVPVIQNAEPTPVANSRTPVTTTPKPVEVAAAKLPGRHTGEAIRDRACDTCDQKPGGCALDLPEAHARGLHFTLSRRVRERVQGETKTGHDRGFGRRGLECGDRGRARQFRLRRRGASGWSERDKARGGHPQGSQRSPIMDRHRGRPAFPHRLSRRRYEAPDVAPGQALAQRHALSGPRQRSAASLRKRSTASFRPPRAL